MWTCVSECSFCDRYSIEAAVAAFAQSRPPGIYKADYLKELFSRYGEVEDTPPAPELPDWCFDDDSGDVDDDGNVIGQESGPSSSAASTGKKKKERLKRVRSACVCVCVCVTIHTFCVCVYTSNCLPAQKCFTDTGTVFHTPLHLL